MILYGKVLSSFKTGNNNLSIKNNKKKNQNILFQGRESHSVSSVKEKYLMSYYMLHCRH